MHGKFFFLMDLPEEWKIMDPKEVREEITSQFDELYGYEKCDENNWYTVVALILPGGGVIPVCGQGDYRGRDTWSDHIARMPRTVRREWARRFAMGCAEYDLDLEYNFGNLPGYRLVEGRNDGKTIEQRDKEIREVVPANHKLVLEAELKDPANTTWKWVGASIGSAYEAYASSEYIPFSKILMTPSDYRDYDLRQNGSAPEECAILMVDVHT